MVTFNQRVNTKLCAVLLVLAFLVPSGAHAQTVTQFQPQTREQIIAYLYGQITQLQILLAEKLAEERGSSSSLGSSNSSNNNSSSRADVEVATLGVQNITEDSVTLRGEIDLDGVDEVFVWFEYVDEDERERETAVKRLTSSRGDRQTFIIQVRNLKKDEKYFYRAVAEDENGDRDFGSARSFTTKGDSGNDSSANNNGDFELSISDRSLTAGDRVTVSWELPTSDVNRQNWIGVYEVGASNRDFEEWKYITEDEGEISFTLNTRGTFEMRLFLNNSYDDEITSRTITVD